MINSPSKAMWHMEIFSFRESKVSSKLQDKCYADNFNLKAFIEFYYTALLCFRSLVNPEDSRVPSALFPVPWMDCFLSSSLAQGGSFLCLLSLKLQCISVVHLASALLLCWCRQGWVWGTRDSSPQPRQSSRIHPLQSDSTLSLSRKGPGHPENLWRYVTFMKERPSRVAKTIVFQLVSYSEVS